MGYYTRFELGIDRDDSDQVILQQFQEDADEGKEFGSYELPIGDDLTDHDSMKWYDHEEDMKTLSKLYPNVLFWLRGDGEEAGDVWKKWFRNGKSTDVRPKMDFPRPANIDELLPMLPWSEMRKFRLEAELKVAQEKADELKLELDRLT